MKTKYYFQMFIANETDCFQIGNSTSKVWSNHTSAMDYYFEEELNGNINVYMLRPYAYQRSAIAFMKPLRGKSIVDCLFTCIFTRYKNEE